MASNEGAQVAAGPREIGPVGTAALAGFASVALAAAAWLLKAFFSERFSVSAAFTALVSVGLATHAWLRRSPRAGISPALAILGWVPTLASGIVLTCFEPIVTSHVRCGTGLVGALFALPFILGTSLLASSALSFRLAALPWVDVAIRILASVGVALTALLLGLTLSYGPRSDADSYLASMHVTGRLEAGASTAPGGETLRYSLRRSDASAPSFECVLERPGGWSRVVSSTWGEEQGVGCAALVILQDPSVGIQVIAREEDRSPIVALRGDEEIDLYPATLGTHLAPPVGWVVGAAWGAFAGMALLGASAWMRRRAENAPGVEGRHDGGGWIVLDDGRRVHVPAAAALEEGPLLVAIERRPGEESYRRDGSPRVLWFSHGTPEEWRRTRRDRAASLEACALTTTLLAVLPLLLALLPGLFGGRS